MYYITILDFANGSVDQYNLADRFGVHNLKIVAHWEAEDFEEFITSEGYRLKDIEWMSHSDGTINYF